MLSAIISTRESERSLVPTLSGLFPAVMTGLLAEVIIADAGSQDATREVADIAGCRFVSSSAPLGERLKAAAQSAKGAWLLFLPAGSVPDAGWVDGVRDFIGRLPGGRAAVFGGRHGLFAGILRSIRHSPKAEHGLLIAWQHYEAIDGHPPDGDFGALLRRIGRHQVATLPVSITVRRYT